MSNTSLHVIQKTFWDERRERLSIDINKRLQPMFSTIRLCILSAKIFNPKKFNGFTLFLDGHDSRLNYEHVFVNKLDLFSYKFKERGVRTQFFSDINGFIFMYHLQSIVKTVLMVKCF
jgi:hypothetical protein